VDPSLGLSFVTGSNGVVYDTEGYTFDGTYVQISSLDTMFYLSSQPLNGQPDTLYAGGDGTREGKRKAMFWTEVNWFWGGSFSRSFTNNF